MTHEIIIRAQHDCPFLEFSKSFGDRQIHSYCSREYDLVLIPGEITAKHIEKGRELFPKKLTDEWRITTTDERSKSSYIIMDCICEELYEESITSLIQHAGGMLNYPIIYEHGWEYHKILCLDKKIVAAVLEQIEKLSTFELISINDLGMDGMFKSQMISIPEIISGLTHRQIFVLIKAYEDGYYEIPRNIRTQDIASDMGITRYGIEKNLRKAENKLIKAIVPYLYFKLEQYKSNSVS
ncbi:MAG: helix-turn-helix domain-containing protein [Candidatus Kariarchaeaceae archaeon]|jgi:predicted DNA binding protein